MFSTAKQKLLIQYLIASPDTLALCMPIIKTSFFDPELRKSVQFIIDYYNTYRAAASATIIEAETGVVFEQNTIPRDEVEYCHDQIELFCRRKALEAAVLNAPELISFDKGDELEQQIKDALSISLTKDLGLDYFDDPYSRLERMSNQPLRTSTGWLAVDDLMGGGLARTEMLLFCANSGGGKSVALTNLALNFAKQHYNVLYVSLELSEDMISQRIDMMLSGIPTFSTQSRYVEIAQAVTVASKNMGKLRIKRMETGTTSNQIRGYIKEVESKEGWIPDLLIVDYLDLMGSNERMDPNNISNKDKLTTEQLRDIGLTYNMFVASASQLNRSAIEAERLNQSHTAGGLTKVNTVDWQLAIVHNSTLKAMAQIMFTFLKARSSSAAGESVYLKWIQTHLKIADSDKTEGNAIKESVQNKTLKGLPEQSAKSFIDMI